METACLPGGYHAVRKPKLVLVERPQRETLRPHLESGGEMLE